MKINVAAIQMESLNGDYEGNRNRAQKYINYALEKGANLIMPPELALTGYIYADAIWKEAELLSGRTSRWLSKLCDQHNVYIATCILECDGKDFYDTFILCGPGGKMWSHRKVEPAGYEAFFLRGAGLNNCVFDTPIGKIGVVICFDASKAYSIKELLAKRPDFLLNPYSCVEMPSSFPKRYGERWVKIYHNTPAILAKQLDVPVVTCNKTGDFLSPMPMGFGMQYSAKFIDRTSIVDHNGDVLSEVDDGPGVAVAKVETKPERGDKVIKVPNGRWFLPVSNFTRIMSGITQTIGQIRYAISRKRRKAASLAIVHD